MPPRPFRRLKIKIEPATDSDIVGMCSIFGEAFRFNNPNLAQVMYGRSQITSPAVEDILKTHLHSQYNKFMVAFDTTKGLVPDPGFEDDGLDEDMSYAWIAVGVMPYGASLNSYTASDLSVHASLKLLATEARDHGEDPRQLNMDDPRVRLARELEKRSKKGQAGYMASPYLVINTLAIWPDSHDDSIWEMASRLLGWAVGYAESHDWPIWTQIPAGQTRFFRQAGFREVEAFTFNLNDAGRQEFVQMVCSTPRERRAENRGGR